MLGLYDNAYPSVYEEIKRFYPVWYWDVLEMDALWKAQGKQLDKVRSAVEALIADNFVITADAATISGLEEFLKIEPDSTRTLDDRRQLISTLLSGDSHIGAKEIREMVSAFTSGEILVSFNNGEVQVKVVRELSERFKLSDCSRVLLSRLPAHLELLFIDAPRPIIFTNRPDMVSFHQFGTRYVFSNTRGGGVVRLDGAVQLDGSILLNQTYSGVAIPRVAITTGFQNTEGLSASITVDSWYTLDGSVPLDGSKRLNARYYKEGI